MTPCDAIFSRILKFSYIFSKFAYENVNFPFLESIGLIFTLCHMCNEEIWKIAQKDITYFRIFLQNWYLALEFSGKKCTHENGTSLDTPLWQVPPHPPPLTPGGHVVCSYVCWETDYSEISNS